MKIPILITGASGGNVGRQCMKALRLVKPPYRIIATDIGPHGVGLYEADKAYIVPMASEKNYFAKILAICQKEKIKIIIPGSEAELLKISDHRDIFIKRRILVLINNKNVIDICQNKWKTADFLKSHSFKVPKYYVPKNKNDIDTSLKYPVVVKPYVNAGGSRGLYFAQNRQELAFFIDYTKKHGLFSIVQEYVGTAEEEYTVGILHTLDGKLLGSVAMKRLVKGALSTALMVKSYHSDEIYTISSGISQGYIGDFKEIRQFAENLADKLGSTGPLNIQCRKTPDGIYVFEINPRFSGTSSIRALCGFNEPDALIKIHYLGVKIAPLKVKKGLILRDLENFYISETKIKQVKNNGKNKKK